MAVKVLIKRKISGDMSVPLNMLFMEIRYAAMRQKGYIGGETLRRVDVPGEYLVISRWQTLEDWNHWLVSDERREYQEKIDTLTDIETKFEVYEH